MLQSILNEAQGFTTGINRGTSLTEDALEMFTLSEEVNRTILVMEMSDFLVQNGTLSEEDATAKSKTLWQKFKAKVKLWINKIKNFFAKLYAVIKNKVVKLMAFIKNLVVDTVEVEVVDIADYQWAYKTILRVQKYADNKAIDSEGLNDEASSFNEKWGDIVMNVKAIKLNKSQIAKYESLGEYLKSAAKSTEQTAEKALAVNDEETSVASKIFGKATTLATMASKVFSRLSTDLGKISNAKGGLGKDKDK